MDSKRKRQLLEEYKNRRPEMGVISFRCHATGEEFLGASKDTKADFNSTRFKLSAGGHPNQRLQELWRQYGESGFDLSVVKILKYDDPQEDHTAELEELREQCLADNKEARRIWR
ncbi:GIY-YIG nuclease family protein [Tumebacillus lipolyticus]|uniref:GIY-YIG nuclease family protein n=1 Tax=Tumebacillus lipolyticus TaxID=1280370 RepID=A0ABW4ZWF9_9BACL